MTKSDRGERHLDMTLSLSYCISQPKRSEAKLVALNSGVGVPSGNPTEKLQKKQYSASGKILDFTTKDYQEKHVF